MGTRRQMTIGITINLDNYENIRFDVTGEVESDTDASELIAFLDGVLSGIGRDDEVTRERVDHYRNRVFGSIDVDTTHGVLSEGGASCPVTEDEVLEEEIFDRDLSGIDTPEPVLSAPESPPLEGQRSVVVSEVSNQEEHHVDVSDVASKDSNALSGMDKSLSALPIQSKEEPSGDAVPKAGMPLKTVSLFVCESCGAEVNKVQHDVSHLFMNKTLCKQCMNRS